MLIEVTQRMNYQVLQASCTHWQVSIWQTICRILPHFSALDHFKCQVTIKWRIGTCSVLSKVGQCVRAAGSSPRFVKLQGWWWNPAKIPQTVSADKWSPDCYGSSEKWLCSVRLIEEGLFLFGVFMCWKIFGILGKDAVWPSETGQICRPHEFMPDAAIHTIHTRVCVITHAVRVNMHIFFYPLGQKKITRQ